MELENQRLSPSRSSEDEDLGGESIRVAREHNFSISHTYGEDASTIDTSARMSRHRSSPEEQRLGIII